MSESFGRDGYRRRSIDPRLDDLFRGLPAVHLDGAKGVGKTATALQRATTTWRLDDPADRDIVGADVAGALAAPPPVLVDEWHRVPATWDAVKRAVDARAPAGSVLLTGSSPAGLGTHSGAGRIVSVRMRPLTLPERGASTPTVSVAELLSGTRPRVSGHCPLTLSDYTDLILASGFPAAQGLTEAEGAEWLDGYLDRIVDADLEEAGLRVRRPASLRAWLRAYAAAVSTSTPWERIRDAATAGATNKPAKTTVLPYRDALTRLRILDDVDGWAPGLHHLKRLTQAPKHHLVDPALAARLLNVDRHHLLRGEGGSVPLPRDGTLLGALFESLSTMTVRVFAELCRGRVAHLRTHDSEHEIDLVVEGRGQQILAVEVKLSTSIKDDDVRHLQWLSRQLGDQVVDFVVLTAGAHAYRRPDGVAVVPLGLLGP